MAQSLTSTPPSHQGERIVYNQLKGLDDDDLFFWQSLDFIPGVQDIDLLIWHKRAGVFVVEIKAFDLSNIKELTLHSIWLADRGISRSPQKQAYDAFSSLRDYLKPICSMPYMVCTVCFPLIQRDEWKEAFSSNQVIASLADSMIMEDDLYSSKGVLKDRLLNIWANPPIRGGSRYEFIHDEQKFDNFRKYVDPAAKPIPNISDLSKIELIEKKISKEIVNSFPPGKKLTIITGKPGTGKTFSILQIAFLHAQEYQKVLICCFNKVLASDIRRILNLQEIINKDNEFYKSIKENIEVLDIYSLITRLNDDFYDKPFDLALESELINNLEKENLNNYPKFDTLLIDESQDFKLDHFRFLKIVSSANSHLVFSNGKGQEIYQNRGFSENKIEDIFEQKASHLSLRKNYRNVKAIFDLSNIFFECKIDEASIAKYFEKYQNKNFIDDLEFELKDIKIPKIIYLEESIAAAPIESNYSYERDKILTSEYIKIIESEIDKSGSDILILVPSKLDNELIPIREALALIHQKKGIAFIDYCADENRSCIAPANTIRLCTFHSARGLEAATVIVLDIERIASICNKLKIDPANLGYIILSRAIFNLTIVLRNKMKNQISHFIIAATEKLKNFYDQRN
jgi:hypothetical protein